MFSNRLHLQQSLRGCHYIQGDVLQQKLLNQIAQLKKDIKTKATVQTL